MNKPLQPPPVADDEIGPLDEHGQQIWSPEEDAAIVRMRADPEFLAGLDEARADIVAGRVYAEEEVNAYMSDVRRRWLAERGLS